MGFIKFKRTISILLYIVLCVIVYTYLTPYVITETTIAPRYKNDVIMTMYNKDICTKDTLWLIYAHSTPVNFARRMILRNTYANKHLYFDWKQKRIEIKDTGNMRVIFLVGETYDKRVQQKLEDEFSLYGDIVQGKFYDHYTNLTRKAVLALKWITSYCRQARYVMKVDDDAFVNVERVFYEMEHYYPVADRPIISGQWYSRMLIRRGGDCGRWCLSQADRWFRADQPFYPPYCSGLATVVSGSLVPHVYRIAIEDPDVLWIDDVWLTGIVMAKLKPQLRRIRFNDRYELSEQKALTAYQTYARTTSERLRLPYFVHCERDTANVNTLWACLLTGLVSRGYYVTPILLTDLKEACPTYSIDV